MIEDDPYERETERGTVYGLRGNLHNVTRKLKSKGADLTSAENLAYSAWTINNGFISTYAGFVRESCLSATKQVFNKEGANGGIFLYREPLIFDPEFSSEEFVRQAIRSHREGSRIYVSDEFAKKIIERGQNCNDLVYRLENRTSVPMERFSEDKRARWLFGQEIENIAEYLLKSGAREFQWQFDDETLINSPDSPRCYIDQMLVSLPTKDPKAIGNSRHLHEEKVIVYGWKDKLKEQSMR